MEKQAEIKVNEPLLIGDDGELEKVIAPEGSLILDTESKPKRKNTPYLRRLTSAARLVALIGVPVSILTLLVMLQVMGVLSLQPGQHAQAESAFVQPAACSFLTEFYDAKNVYGASGLVSPDGSFAVYKKYNDITNLYLKGLRSGLERNLTFNTPQNNLTYDGMIWAPNSRLLGFSFFNHGLVNAYVLNLDDNTMHPVTNYTTGENLAGIVGWFPGNQKLIFHVQGHDHGLYTAKIDGSEVQRISSDMNDEVQNVSPDGKHIAFIHDQQIYVMDANGLNRGKLTNAFLSTQNPQWSVDGKYIKFDGYIIGNHSFTLGGSYSIDWQGTNPNSLCRLS